MKQHEAVIKAMEENGGYASLEFLYQRIDTTDWQTSTPFESIRRSIYIHKDIFYNIDIGVWGLKKYEHILSTVPEKIQKTNEDEEKKSSEHYFYQGLVVELGNMKNLKTYIPPQDKNQFMSRTKILGEVAKTIECPQFASSNIIQRIRTIDVIWFNDKDYPQAVYEIEHTSHFSDSLLKFVELQDFDLEFWVVAHTSRKREFEEKIKYRAFESIMNRVRFWEYDNLLRERESANVIFKP